MRGLSSRTTRVDDEVYRALLDVARRREIETGKRCTITEAARIVVLGQSKRSDDAGSE